MFYNARYYDPVIGRFISADTIVPDPSNPQDLNRYSYVRNNPANYTDPDGHTARSWIVHDGQTSGSGGTFDTESPTRQQGIADPACPQCSAQAITASFVEDIGKPRGLSPDTVSRVDPVRPIVDFAVDNRGTLATVGAVGFCVLSAGSGCGLATIVALGFRSEQTLREQGVSSDSLEDVATDALITGVGYGLFSLPAAKALPGLVGGQRTAARYLLGVPSLELFLADVYRVHP